MTHLKRFSIPRTWRMSRKSEKFAVTPSPGPHGKMECIPLRVVLRDVLGYADNCREARSVLSQGKILVDRRPRKSSRYPAGLMDVIEIADTRQKFRVTVGPGGLELESIDDSDAGWKICRIRGKTTIRGGICQLNLHDGRNITVKKDTYRVGDSVKISLPDQKILKQYSLEKGSHALITAGRNMGTWGSIKEIEERKHSLEKSTITLDTRDGEIKTLRKYIFVAEMPARHKAGHEPAGEKPEKNEGKPAEPRHAPKGEKASRPKTKPSAAKEKK